MLGIVMHIAANVHSTYYAEMGDAPTPGALAALREVAERTALKWQRCTFRARCCR
jgi:hypothetical protein